LRFDGRCYFRFSHVLERHGKADGYADCGARRTKSNRILAPAPSSLVPMAVNLLVDISSRMRRLQGSCCGREGVMRGWPRYRIRLVSSRSPDNVSFCTVETNVVPADCPEREATYIITNGGISDPEKV